MTEPDEPPEPTGAAEVQDLDDVDWPALWDEFGCSVDGHMSETQLALALKVSDQDVGPSLPDRVGPEDGRCPDGLIDSWTTASPLDGDNVDWLRGYLLAPEVRPDA